MAGSVVIYQGHTASSVVFRRSRGWSPDTSVVTFPVNDPDGANAWRFDPAATGSQVRGTLAEIQGNAVLAVGQPRVLGPVGELLLGEVAQDGSEWSVRVPWLWVARLETVRQGPGLAVFRAHLVDARYFLGRGSARRWSFNRLRGDGSLALDSLGDDGKPLTLRQIADELVSGLGRYSADAPLLKLARAPSTWDSATEALELEPLSPPMRGLARLVTDHGLEEPCLRLDGVSLSLHEAGDGRVGFAKGSVGGEVASGENLAAIPDTYALWKQGRGQGRVIEPGYPEEFPVVVGGVRVVTVAVDDWEPVLVQGGSPVPLTEETVRALTKDRFGIDWLARWILAPPAYQNDVGLPDNVVELLRSQAWKLWRLPKAAKPDGGVGENAHLLPLLARAETANGRRLPPIVQTYRFATRHRALLSSAEDLELSAVWRSLARLREALRDSARAKGSSDPWSQKDDALGQLSAGGVLQLLDTADAAELSVEDIQGLLDQARALETAQAVDSALAKGYEDQLRKKLALEDAASGSQRVAAFDFAKELVALEKRLRAKLTDSLIGLGTDQARAAIGKDASTAQGLLQKAVADGKKPADQRDPSLTGFRATLAELALKAKALAEKKRAAEADKALRKATGAPITAKPLEVVHFRNLPRSDDPSAHVLDEKLGIVQLGKLPGWLTKEDVSRASDGGPFVPGPVRVVFGVELRPRTDRVRVATGQGSASATGAPGEQRTPALGGLVGGDNVIPEVLTDEASVFSAAFRRKGRGVVAPIDVSAVPPGRAFVVSRHDLVELVPLDGQGNRNQLLETARSVAAGLARRKDVVDSTKHVFGRPWPVQCDGLVASVEIRSRPGGKGFETEVTTGSTAFTIAAGLGTRDRSAPRGRESSDGATREGLR